MKIAESDLKSLADGCGEIARGFKKLKAFLSSGFVLSLRGQSDPKKPETAVSLQLPKPVWELGAGFCPQCGYRTRHRGAWNKHLRSMKHIFPFMKQQLEAAGLPVSLPSDDESESVSSNESESSVRFQAIVQWVLSRKAGWGPQHNEQLAQFMVGERWRGDNYKNYWRYVGPEEETRADLCLRTNWNTVSHRTVCKLYDEYGERLEDLQEYLEEQSNGKTETWMKIHPSKRRRLKNVMEGTPISMIRFTRIMKDTHKDLPPLRGGVKTV